MYGNGFTTNLKRGRGRPEAAAPPPLKRINGD